MKKVKSDKTVTANEAWLLARKIVELAYSFEKDNLETDQDAKTDNSLASVFIEIQQILDKRDNVLTAELTKVVHVAMLERITDVFSKITKGTITDKEAKEKIFLTMTTGEDDESTTEDIVLWSKKQITELQGPKEAATEFLNELKDLKRSTLLNHQRNLTAKSINTSYLSSTLKVIRNKDDFRKAVITKIIESYSVDKFESDNQ